LQQAVHQLAALPQTQLLSVSSLYQSTAAEGAAGSGDFFNAAVKLSTQLDAYALLAALQTIELAAGRERPHRHAPRTLDLDILLYGCDPIADAPRLIVPHPRLWERDFVLLPLAELRADLNSHPHCNNTTAHNCQIVQKNWL
jgi:2-amino-4-hydroxy-6-hydroxymethyldihydropteridine diphosphokinase